GCGIRRDTDRAYQLHDVDQQALATPATKGTFLPMEGDEIYPSIRAACRLARTGAPGPVFVEVPANLYLARHEVELPEPEGGEGRESRAGLPGATANVDPGAVERTVELLRASSRPFVYVGAGAAAAGDRVLALAERLEAPVATTFQGKGVFPETHPLFLWPGFGDAAPPFARKVARRRDLTLAVGCRFGEVGTGSWGLEPPGALVHVDLDPGVPGRNFPAEVAVTADSGAFLDALLRRLEEKGLRRKRDDLLREEIRDGHLEVWEEWAEAASRTGVSPPYLLRTCQEVFGPETVFTADSGNGTFLAVECLRLEAPGRFLAPVDYSCMGYAVPAALGARLARAEAPVVALAGDGAFLMTGLELLTAVRERLAVAVLVLRDRELAQIAQFQETALARKVGSRVPDYDLEALARGLGVEFLAMGGDDEVEEVLERAREVTSGGRPVLVDVAVDYSGRTFFTRGVVRTAFARLPLKDQARFVGRAVVRRLTE
ncbi:MAG TPA: thiamine pyrophosphate-dependent enzyme, partial [Longimicrobiales bacterium]|nr:thiamine pyrophosphate-dependent enzyme [Longimicrobiales bacterium]